MANVTPLLEFIDLKLPDNTSGAITAADLRAVLVAQAMIVTSVAPGAGVVTLTVVVPGASIADVALANRNVAGVIIDDLTKNTGFTKPPAGSTLTFTDGTFLQAGQTVTIFLS